MKVAKKTLTEPGSNLDLWITVPALSHLSYPALKCWRSQIVNVSLPGWGRAEIMPSMFDSPPSCITYIGLSHCPHEGASHCVLPKFCV